MFAEHQKTCTVSLNGLFRIFHAEILNSLQGGCGLVKTCPGLARTIRFKAPSIYRITTLEFFFCVTNDFVQ
jgi:hypothetical protein